MAAHTENVAQGATLEQPDTKNEQVLLIIEEVEEGDWKTNCCYGMDGKTSGSHTHYFVVDRDSNLFKIVDEGRDDILEMVLRQQENSDDEDLLTEESGISRDELDALINYADDTRRYFSNGKFVSLNISGIIYTSYVTDE
jgi:hypothetical protein